MAVKRYKFNPHTRAYEVITLPFQVRFYRFLRHVLIAFIFASVVTMLFSYFFYTPKMHRINERRNDLLLEYALLNQRIATASEQLTAIRQRDNSVYRALFAVDSLSIPGIYTPYAEAKYASFSGDRYAPLIGSTWSALDALGRQIYAELLSLDELAPLASDKELMAESIPAIWPVDQNDIRNIGRYGRRIDPITNQPGTMHYGMDFSGPQGTPIYATGNGTVMTPTGGSGYGRQVMIDHGFGYRTRYGHLSRILVEPGQKVVRGEQIGLMGNTGRSVGSHLHYEVLYRGNKVNPISYFSREMEDADFQSIIESAKEATLDANYDE
ncbi:MAG: M23 family metallopeptidase [Rikenellaceae bacterium]|jgi:murein DD-endopeptidase MepM/ murein hydrolase activator NlpD|nr:M23 family metallopeptidase [Rikenellaceae bacterium]